MTSSPRSSAQKVVALLVAGVLSSISLASAAINLSSGYYFQDFDGTLEADWVLANVATRDIPAGGRTTLTNVANGSSSYYGSIIMNAAGGYGNVGDQFAPILPASSYANHGFGGKWLTNTVAMARPTIQTDLVRTATVSFDQLGSHSSIGLQFLLGAGDSFDGINEGIFEIWIDGNLQWSQQFTNGGRLATGSSNHADFLNIGPAPTALEVGGNLLGTGFYYESWSSTATNETQRLAAGWTVESAYSVNIDAIAHTSDTMNLQFVWRGIDGDWTDEFLSIDNLTVTVPEPGYVGLMMFGFAGLVLRRRRVGKSLGLGLAVEGSATKD